MTTQCPACTGPVPDATELCPRCDATRDVPLRLSWLARLFWACPACRAEASLVGQQPFFGQASLVCRACGVSWRLEDHGRALTQLDPVTRQPREVRPLADWLASLPPPYSGRPMPARGLLLLPGEQCFARIELARMLTPRQATRQAQVAGRLTVLPGIYERTGRDPLGPPPSALALVAAGPLFITDRRVVFMGDRKQLDLPLNRLMAVEVDEGYLLLHRPIRTDTFSFARESAARVRTIILLIQARGDGAASEHAVSTTPPSTPSAVSVGGENGAQAPDLDRLPGAGVRQALKRRLLARSR